MKMVILIVDLYLIPKFQIDLMLKIICLSKMHTSYFSDSMAFDDEKKLERALDLMRRVPPQNTNKHLGDLIDLCPSLTEELLSAVDQPLSTKTDDMKEMDFIICDYNR